jgi:hypothetical protein
MDASGALYGVNNDGGTQNCGDEGCGNMYKLTPSGNGRWVYTDVHDFSEGNDGCLPVGPPALDAAGNVYGASHACGAGGSGTVWEYTPSQ